MTIRHSDSWGKSFKDIWVQGLGFGISGIRIPGGGGFRNESLGFRVWVSGPPNPGNPEQGDPTLS